LLQDETVVSCNYWTPHIPQSNVCYAASNMDIVGLYFLMKLSH
jgi:hypothetical protein